MHGVSLSAVFFQNHSGRCHDLAKVTKVEPGPTAMQPPKRLPPQAHIVIDAIRCLAMDYVAPPLPQQRSDASISIPIAPKAAPMPDTPNTSQTSFADGKILKRVTDGVGIITFNNPEKRNAMSLDMWEGLGQALVELRDDA